MRISSIDPCNLTNSKARLGPIPYIFDPKSVPHNMQRSKNCALVNPRLCLAITASTCKIGLFFVKKYRSKGPSPKTIESISDRVKKKKARETHVKRRWNKKFVPFCNYLQRQYHRRFHFAPSWHTSPRLHGFRKQDKGSPRTIKRNSNPA